MNALPKHLEDDSALPRTRHLTICADTRKADRARGGASASTPTSVVVPPMSITVASWQWASAAAPRSELTGPDWNVSTGTAHGRCIFFACFRKERGPQAYAPIVFVCSVSEYVKGMLVLDTDFAIRPTAHSPSEPALR